MTGRRGEGIAPAMRMSGLVRTGLVLTCALALGGCAIFDALGGGKNEDDSDKEIAPKSRRVSVLELEKKLEPDPRIADLEVTVPAAKVNTNWSQPGGDPTNAFHHLQIGDGPSADASKALKKLWSIDAGRGSSTTAPLTAPPIIAGDRIFVLDARVTVRAFSREDPDQLWERNLTPEDENAATGFGGGLAFDDGKLFAVTGFGQVIAMNAEDGEIIWEKNVGVPIRSAPTAAEGRLFVTATDNQLHAYDMEEGRSLWSHRAMSETAGILSAVSPAVSGDLIVAPFTSGELIAFRVQNGRETWADDLVRTGKATAMAGINDIAARPVIDGGRVYAVSHSGRMVSIDQRTGERVWTRNIAGVQTPWVAGDFIFLVTVDAELIAVSRRDGRIRWLTRLKRYEDAKDRTGSVAWMGPLLVSGRLLMMNSLGEMAFFSPKDGKVQVAFAGPGEAYIPPVVANGTIYVLTDDGRLTAMR